MRRPQPTKMDTDREKAAVTFAFEHFRMSNKFGRDACSYLTVQTLRRDFLFEVFRDEVIKLGNSLFQHNWKNAR